MSEKWELEAHGNGVFFPGKNVQRCFALCQGENRHENAKLVARAVNAHAALVEALRECVELLDKLPAFSRESSAIEQACAALALAEEKP